MSHMDMTAGDIRRDEQGQQRESRIEFLADLRHKAACSYIVAGNKETAKDAAEALAEHLVSCTPDGVNLVRIALSCGHEVTGKAFCALLEKVMRCDADATAAREVAEDEANAKPLLRAAA